ncbi:MAG: NrdH-redoxin [Betaproteobacteria bacterium]|nr:NrdH-redoxin [Betaproteobacteria bacterium]
MVRGIEYQSVNVLEDQEGLAAMRAMGARSVPVVARGGKFVYAQVIKDVVEFLGLNELTGPELLPAALADRAGVVLSTAARLVRQMPQTALVNQLPHRPRSWRVLMHHIFQIPTAFLEMEERGTRLEYEVMVAEPPATMLTSAEIAEFGDAVQRRFNAWWARARSEDFSGMVPTYFGETTRHEMLERTVWHSAQHVRQLAALLEQVGIRPDRPLGAQEIRGLPLTEKIWDET